MAACRRARGDRRPIVNMHSARILLLLLHAGAALVLPGCASFTGPVPYPEAWLQPDAALTADGCPRLEGTYSNRGDAVVPAELGAPPGLVSAFARMAQATGLTAVPAGKAWTVPADADAVTIAQTPETLKVSFLGAGGVLGTLDFRRYRFNWSESRYDDQYTCYTPENGPRLRFMAEPESYSIHIPNLYLGAGGTLVFLLKAADGSLVVQWRNESVGISALIVGTHITFRSVWWRYPQLRR